MMIIFFFFGDQQKIEDGRHFLPTGTCLGGYGKASQAGLMLKIKAEALEKVQV